MIFFFFISLLNICLQSIISNVMATYLGFGVLRFYIIWGHFLFLLVVNCTVITIPYTNITVAGFPFRYPLIFMKCKKMWKHQEIKKNSVLSNFFIFKSSNLIKHWINYCHWWLDTITCIKLVLSVHSKLFKKCSISVYSLDFVVLNTWQSALRIVYSSTFQFLDIN